MVTKERLLAIGHLWIVATLAITAFVFLNASGEPEGLDWLTWAHNTDPDGDSFVVYYRGEFPHFGGIKLALDLDIESGQYLCVKLEQENLDEAAGRYNWWVQIWWDSTTGTAMDFQTGAICIQIYTLHHRPTNVFKMHIYGEGHGGVRVTPIITVEDERIYKPTSFWGVPD